jgi:transcriptional regulator with XRE-family HTH domain
MNKHIGSTLESLFDELGEGDEFRLGARKMAFVIAAEQRMAALKLSKAGLAKRLGTSRPAVDRLLDPRNTSLTLATLGRATRVLGLDFSLTFTEVPTPRGRKVTKKRPLPPARKHRSSSSHAR